MSLSSATISPACSDGCWPPTGPQSADGGVLSAGGVFWAGRLASGGDETRVECRAGPPHPRVLGGGGGGREGGRRWSVEPPHPLPSGQCYM